MTIINPNQNTPGILAADTTRRAVPYGQLYKLTDDQLKQLAGNTGHVSQFDALAELQRRYPAAIPETKFTLPPIEDAQPGILNQAAIAVPKTATIPTNSAPPGDPTGQLPAVSAETIARRLAYANGKRYPS